MLTDLLSKIKVAIDAANLGAVEFSRRADAIALALEQVSIPTDLSFKEINLGLLTHFPSADSSSPLAAHRRFLAIERPLYDVELITWLGFDTAVHNHPFDGVLHVLTGESLNLNYSFCQSGEDGDLKWGDLNVTSVTQVGPHRRFVFRSHSDFIHKVIHLNHECCSLRIMARSPTLREGQWSYPVQELALPVVARRQQGFFMRVPLLDYWYANDRSAFRLAIEKWFAAGHRAEAISYLAFLRAKFDDVVETENAIVESRHLSTEAKTKILENFSGLAVSMLPPYAKRLGRETELFLALVATFGFGRKMAGAIAPTLNREAPLAWVTQRLMEITLSVRPERALALSLLNRLNEWERGGHGTMATPTSFISEAWRVDQFETFLSDLKSANLLIGGGQ